MNTYFQRFMGLLVFFFVLIFPLVAVHASSISGTVTGPDGVTPLSNIYVESGNISVWAWGPSTYTDSNGQYELTGLAEGTHHVSFRDLDGAYTSEVYENIPGSDIWNAGTDIEVGNDATVLDINASLAVASKITGTVTAGTNGLENIYVTAYRWTGQSWDSSSLYDYTDASGEYEIGGLVAGTYRLKFEDFDGNYLMEVYDNIPGSSVYNSGTDILVGEGETVSGIDASLAIASKITGTVTDGITGLENINVTAYRWNGSWWSHTSSDSTDTNGVYEVGGLNEGTYRVSFSDGNGNYAPEVYTNFPGDDYSNVGTPIVVGSESTVSDINASLAIASKITGTVTGSGGITGLQDISVTAYRWNGAAWRWNSSDYTDANGVYEVGGLAVGTYRVSFSDGSGNYVPEAYNDIIGGSAWNSGALILVGEGATVSPIDASLDEYASLSGSVMQADGTTPIAGVQVHLLSGGEITRTVRTGADGSYGFSQLYIGDYTVRTTPSVSIGYLGEWYDNAGLYISGQDTPPGGAAVITLSSGENQAGIDFDLDPAGRITGTVIGNGDAAIAGAYVKAVIGAYDLDYIALTDEMGGYELPGLLPGNYLLKASADEFRDEWYEDATHKDSATSFAIASGDDLTHDFDLLPGQNPALVEVRCDPEVNATVYVDYQATTNVTPTVLDIGEAVTSHSSVMGGWTIASHVITVRKAGVPRVAPQIAAAVESETITVTIDMTSSESGSVFVASTPDGTEVFIDYADVADGVTPLEVGSLAPGSHTIMLKNAGFLQSRPIVALVEAGLTNVISIPLVSELSSDRIMAELQSSPTGAVIYVDYLPTTEITGAVIDWMDPASHSGSGWYSASHAIMLRKPWKMPTAPRLVPDVINVLQSNQVQLLVDTVAVADEDADGLPDQWEESYQDMPGWAAQGPDDDYDGDGVSNYGELIGGTDPSDSNSVLEFTDGDISLLAGDSFTLTFNSVPGHRYFIRGATSLDNNPEWTTLCPVIVATESQTSSTVMVPENIWIFQLVVWAP